MSKGSYKIETKGCGTLLFYFIAIALLIACMIEALWEHRLDIEYKQKIINQPDTVGIVTEKVQEK